MLDMILSTILNGKQVNTPKPRVIIRFLNKKPHNTDYSIEPHARMQPLVVGPVGGGGAGLPQPIHRPPDFGQRFELLNL